MNICVFKGRLTADPELRTTPSSISVTKFSIAVDGYAKQGEEKKVDFIRCTAWRGTADFISKYFQKGQEILVRGSLHNADYTDANGVKHYSMDVTVDNVEFCGSKNSSSGQQQNSSENVEIGDLGDFEEILSDGDVPF
ncbi:single-stranded DNA-binding protein [Treponema sp.]|uniref:single-stranded DNA-binding protein n=1 Tax=Treponema sp. TaxID=166 RepID=UPI003890C6DE